VLDAETERPDHACGLVVPWGPLNPAALPKFGGLRHLQVRRTRCVWHGMALRAAGFTYDSRTRRIRRTGPFAGTLPFRYLGADDRAGPNYTGQPAVHSYYESTL
jgi:hypothetical protein